MDLTIPTAALKRSCSVPIIENGQQSPKPPTPTPNHIAASPVQMPSKEPLPTLNIFSSRVRRYSASFSPLAKSNASRLSQACIQTPRVSQLRQEECADISNIREVNHEREVHTAMQLSQSWEDLTLCTENWSCKSGDSVDLSNPLHVNLPAGQISCSSPSPNSRNGLRMPVSPSPTRKTFTTRRSMSPIPMRASPLSAVKRKFEMDDVNSYSPPPFKKMFTDRGPSPICQSPSPVCPSPDSWSYEGRTTPKLFLPKLNTNTTNSISSVASSPSIPSPLMESPQMDIAEDASSTTESSGFVSSGDQAELKKPTVKSDTNLTAMDLTDQSNGNEDEKSLVHMDSKETVIEPKHIDTEKELTKTDSDLDISVSSIETNNASET